MKLAIITHVNHKLIGNKMYAYAPYVMEMNLWLKYVDSVTIVAPKISGTPSKIEIDYKHNDIDFQRIPSIQFTTLKYAIISIFRLPIILMSIFKTCKKADHIHLRCPGNIGLLGCIVQFFFPNKVKTAKYAGNWDATSQQPKSYKFQKWILSNTMLTKNMQVLVYGSWPNQTKNIKNFFTATYRDFEVPKLKTPLFSGTLNILFVGSLSPGKRPLYVIEWAKACRSQDLDIQVDFYGNGTEKAALEACIIKNNLEKIVTLHGNQPKEIVLEAYKRAHFLILPSKSEGWPKVIAEAMFWGVIPLVTPISCVPWMVGEGSRGILLDIDVNKDVSAFAKAIKDEKMLQAMSIDGQQWSHQYTLDRFENSIKELL